jgi:hypothetical protein
VKRITLLLLALAGCEASQSGQGNPDFITFDFPNDGGWMSCRRNSSGVYDVDVHVIETIHMAPGEIESVERVDEFEEPELTRVFLRDEEYRTYVTETPDEIDQLMRAANGGLVTLHRRRRMLVYIDEKGNAIPGQKARLLDDPDLVVVPYEHYETKRWEYLSEQIRSEK